MTHDILESLKTEFGDVIVGMLGKCIGEDAPGTLAALGAAFPAVLGGIYAKGTSAQGASEVMDMIAKGGIGEDALMDLKSVFSGDHVTKELLARGTELLKGIFGDKASGVTDLVAAAGGIGKGSAASLLGLVVPVVLGFLGKEVKEGKLGVPGLMALLSAQVEPLKAAAPAGLGGILGLLEFSGVPGGARSFQGFEGPGRFSVAWKWALPMAILAAVLAYMLRACSVPPPVKTSVEQAEKAAEDVGGKMAAGTGGLPERLGKFLSVRLPGGLELSVPESGVERKLVAFIEDPGRPVDKTTWFTFDRLEFETGSATLSASSMEQLRNVAEILKAYPKVALKIGGYTDNVGDPGANRKLSARRAETTKAELVRLGVDARRLEAEGYGEKHPVADNSTEEGRRRNRRIDMRVTRK
jgi:outer membrane protein OmpA-like peptidoglycan-associated protein